MKIGLEIHFQLNTGKLFCRCPCDGNEKELFRFSRSLSSLTGESGNIDPAARYEGERSRNFTYIVTENSCLVECDEEPPHSINESALLTAIAVSKALHCTITDKVTYMRKIVVDGSNTSGFQRTAIIGMNGYMETPSGNVRISTVCLEEDAARKIEEKENTVIYSLDRLGIPLIEVSTEPDIKSKDHAVETARQIGYLIMATGNSRRSVDAIRQDVNMSMDYGRVEIKGVQRLSLIKDLLDYEEKRQTALSSAAEIISGRGGFAADSFIFRDVSNYFSDTKSSLISNGLKHGKIYAAIAKNLAGTLKNGNMRIGKEIADVMKSFGVKGILHSDELPAYGITSEEMDRIYADMGRGKDDAVIMVITDEAHIDFLRERMVERIQKILSKDFSETRGPDGEETRFLRPMPGKERMYPETDIPVISVTGEQFNLAEKMKPPAMDESISSLVEKFGISRQIAESIVRDLRMQIFTEFSSLYDPKEVARTMQQTIPELEKKLKKTIDESTLREILEIAGKLNLDRYQLQRAFEVAMSTGLSMNDLIAGHYLDEIGPEEIERLILDAEKKGLNINDKNLINEFRKMTTELFDPKAVLEIYKKLKNR